jgi:hypothetical protein
MALVLGAVTAGTAEARSRPAGRGKRFSANKTFGVGLMLGAPSGFSAKYFLSRNQALDFGVGAIGYYRHRDGLHLHMDYLFHPVSLVSARPFELPLYFGIGGRVFDFDDDDLDDHGLAIGVRAPIGISFDFNNVPLDIFFEIALVLDFVRNYRDEVLTDVNGAIGIRYYFN